MFLKVNQLNGQLSAQVFASFARGVLLKAAFNV
jgi:hypothetical protein